MTSKPRSSHVTLSMLRFVAPAATSSTLDRWSLHCAARSAACLTHRTSCHQTVLYTISKCVMA